MKKILIVYDSMMTGGTTTALLSLLNEFDYNQYSVDLLMFENTGAFYSSIPSSVNVLSQAYKNTGVLSLSKRKILRTILNGNAFKSLLSYYKYRGTPKGNLRNILMHYGIKSQVSLSRAIEDSYDCAIGFIEGWADQFVLSPKVKAKKKIIWVHPDYQSSYLIPEIDKQLFRYATYIVTVSQQCEFRLKEVFPEFSEKVLCIENISSCEYIKNRANESTPKIKKVSQNFCTVARCDIDVKGLDRILSAINKLKLEGLTQNMLWHYIGDGRDFLLLKDMINKYGLENEIVCYGQQTNPLTYLKQMDCFILASRYEGKPISVEESLSLRIPCIVTEYAAAREQVVDGITGYVCSNSDDSIYEKLKEVITQPQLLKSLKDNMPNRMINCGEIEKIYSII